METTRFEHLGYSKDYYFNGKYFGSLPCEKDRETLGYYGRKPEILPITITFQNKKKIKAGSQVFTELQMLCGKIIKEPANA